MLRILLQRHQQERSIVQIIPKSTTQLQTFGSCSPSSSRNNCYDSINYHSTICYNPIRRRYRSDAIATTTTTTTTTPLPSYPITRRSLLLWDSSTIYTNECSVLYTNTTNSAVNSSINYQLHQYQQIRWKGRKDGNRYTSSDHLLKARSVSKKKRKQYHQHIKMKEEKYSHHGAPGSKAGFKREYIKRQQEEIMNTEHKVRDAQTMIQEKSDYFQSNKYTMEDALLDDLMGNSNTQMTPTPTPSYIGHLHTYYYNQVMDTMDDYYMSLSSSKSNTASISNSGQQQQQLDGATSSSSSASVTSTSPTNNEIITNDVNNNAMKDVTITTAAELPTDEMISKALRAYRDRNGTSKQPVGIIKALQHVLYDMQIPTKIIGEYTYTTLLTCCASPNEGRRIIQMIRDHGLPISDYSYSILCHLYAKQGDYMNCVQVQKEMLEKDNISPTLASYTSLFAACYQVINTTGRIAHEKRIDATKVAWDKWQEMRIIGITPDVMAYGAMLRIKAASGKAEECINLINEMHRFKVYPTTLCYTTALRAVARSHSIALRYEKGTSKRHRRRELVTQYHGKLTREIAILADSAGIVKDDGYISALCLCTGIAGDLATTKAIYIANEIIRACQNTNLRRVGSNDHLERLRGIDNYNNNNLLLPVPENNEQQRRMTMNDNNDHSYVPYSGQEEQTTRYGYNNNETLAVYQSNTDITTQQQSPYVYNNGKPNNRYIPTHGEREYGKDGRILSSILYACAQSVHPNGMGMIWQGRENKGYLCINSLRLIGQIKLPQYTDNSLPGQKMTDNLKVIRDEEDREGYRDGKRKPRKFAGVDVDENVASSLDDILGDKELAKRYINPDGRRKFEYRSFTSEEVWRLKYGDDWDKDVRVEEMDPTTGQLEASRQRNTINSNDPNPKEERIVNSYLKSISDGDTKTIEVDDSQSASSDAMPKRETPVSDIYFDYNSMSWKPKSEQQNQQETTKSKPIGGDNSKASDHKDNTPPTIVEEEMYFDNDTMRWKTRPKISSTTNSTAKTSSVEQNTITGSIVVDDNNLQDDADDSDIEDKFSDDDDDDWKTISDDSDDEDEDYYFDKKEKRWVLRSQPSLENKVTSDEQNQASEKSICESDFDNFDSVSDDKAKSKSSEGGPEKHAEYTAKATTTKTVVPVVANIDDKLDEDLNEEAANEEAFKVFFSELRQESLESGQEDVTEEEARELFEQMKDEYNEMIVMTPEELGLIPDPMNEKKPSDTPNSTAASDTETIQGSSISKSPSFNEKGDSGDLQESTQPEKSNEIDTTKKTINLAVNGPRSVHETAYIHSDTLMEKFWSEGGDQAKHECNDTIVSSESSQDNYSYGESVINTIVSNVPYETSYGSTSHTATISPSLEDYYNNNDEQESYPPIRDVVASSNAESPIESSSNNDSMKNMIEVLARDESQEDHRLVLLREILPGFSDRRLLKIIRCYQSNLSDPPLLELVPIVRENMPDYITSTWLKQMASFTARFVVQKAAEDDVVNTQILNAVLELQTSAGSLDKAIEFHQTEFARHNLEPTQYSDRLVLQMLLRNSRFNRALAFKQTVEQSGRTLDLKSYGSLIEHCSRRKQLGSAILLLKECLSSHNAPPSEASLTNLRLLCRQAGIDKEIGLENMIGIDPLEWLRHGERELKREYSKKGRRDVQLSRNALVRL